MLNKVTLMGRLTADPEVKKVGDNISVVEISVACDSDYAKKGEDKKVVFVGVQYWRGTADFVGKYFHKGDMIAVEGRLDVQEWTDKETSKKRTKLFISGEKAYFAGSKNGGGDNTVKSSKNEGAPKEEAYATSPFDGFAEITDDDLPY